MGEVYGARDLRLQRDVAIKVVAEGSTAMRLTCGVSKKKRVPLPA